jgi:prophage antirepressor-like protein
VAAALDVKWTGHTLGSIPKSWQGMVKLTTPSGKQELTIISEPAVYKLAFRSNKPEAEAFTNWVAGEVLPAIRKTGRYELPTLTPDQQRKIQQLIGEKVYATGNKKLYPTLFKQIYRSIKDEFHVGKYNQVPVDRFSELVAYVGKVNVGGQEEFNEADQIHMKDIADVADGISNELKTVTKTLFLVQAYVGRVLQDVCVLMPREFAEMKRRKRIAEN